MDNESYEGPHTLRHFGNRLAELAEIGEGASVLDLGMGLGSSLFPAVEKVGKKGTVIGIDISEEMVRGTYDKIMKCNITNASVIQTDAKSLIFKDNTFDVVLSGFSYIYSTLKEINRVLKEGGQFGLSTWEYMEDAEWLSLFLKKYIPVGEMYHKDTPEKLRTLLYEAQFANVTVITEKKEFAYVNEEHWWKDIYESGWREELKKIEDMGVTLEEFKKDAFKNLQAYKRAHGIPFTVSVHFAFGIK